MERMQALMISSIKIYLKKQKSIDNVEVSEIYAQKVVPCRSEAMLTQFQRISSRSDGFFKNGNGRSQVSTVSGGGSREESSSVEASEILNEVEEDESDDSSDSSQDENEDDSSHSSDGKSEDEDSIEEEDGGDSRDTEYVDGDLGDSRGDSDEELRGEDSLCEAERDCAEWKAEREVREREATESGERIFEFVGDYLFDYRNNWDFVSARHPHQAYTFRLDELLIALGGITSNNIRKDKTVSTRRLMHSNSVKQPLREFNIPTDTMYPICHREGRRTYFNPKRVLPLHFLPLFLAGQRRSTRNLNRTIPICYNLISTMSSMLELHSDDIVFKRTLCQLKENTDRVSCYLETRSDAAMCYAKDMSVLNSQLVTMREHSTKFQSTSDFLQRFSKMEKRLKNAEKVAFKVANMLVEEKKKKKKKKRRSASTVPKKRSESSGRDCFNDEIELPPKKRSKKNH